MIKAANVVVESHAEGVALPANPPLAKDGTPKNILVNAASSELTVYGPMRLRSLKPGEAAVFVWKEHGWREVDP